MQAVETINRRRVVIGALALPTPVPHNQIEIEKPALHLALALADFFRGPGTKADGG